MVDGGVTSAGVLLSTAPGLALLHSRCGSGASSEPAHLPRASPGCRVSAPSPCKLQLLSLVKTKEILAQALCASCQVLFVEMSTKHKQGTPLTEISVLVGGSAGEARYTARAWHHRAQQNTSAPPPMIPECGREEGAHTHEARQDPHGNASSLTSQFLVPVPMTGGADCDLLLTAYQGKEGTPRLFLVRNNTGDSFPFLVSCT